MFDGTVLRTHLLDLLHELRGKGIDLILGGGYPNLTISPTRLTII
jgi:hypothetical protein